MALVEGPADDPRVVSGMDDLIAARHIGVVGLGAMGDAAVAQLVAVGARLRCYDTSYETLRNAARRHRVTACADAVEVASGCDTVLTFLPTSEAVRSVAAQVLPVMGRGAYLLDMSTCEPPLALELDQLFRAQDRNFVDCPVSRKAPNSSIYVGGTAEDLSGVSPLLARLGKEVFYCGQVGAGYLTKALHQYVKYARFDTALRAIRYGEARGLDAATTAAAIMSGTAGAEGLGTAEEAVGAVPRTRTHAPARIVRKDIDIVVDMFARTGHPDATASQLGEFWKKVCDAGYADRPYIDAAEFFHDPGGA